MNELDSQLLKAAGNGEAFLIKSLVKQGANINAQSEDDGHSVLHFAALCASLQTLVTVLSLGANPNITDKQGRTPLHYAIRNEAKVRALLEYSADPHIAHQDDISPLQLAAEQDLECFAQLCMYTDDMHLKACNRHGNSPLQTALFSAVNSVNLKIIIFTIIHGVNLTMPNKDGDLAIELAAQLGDAECVLAMLNAGLDVNLRGKNDSTLLHLAAENGHENLIKILLRIGADRHALCNGQKPSEVVVNTWKAEAAVSSEVWNYLTDNAKRALTATLPSPLLIKNGYPTDALVELCSARRLNELFTAEKWKGREKEGIEYAAQIAQVLPGYWSQRTEVLPDISALQHADMEHPDWLRNILHGDETKQERILG